MHKSNSLILLTVIGLTLGKELPDGFKRCRRNDPKLGQCLLQAVTDVLPQMKNGLPDFGIPSIDPLAINALTIQQGKNSPINLKQDFKNIQLSGISETRLTKYNPDLNNYILRCDGLTPRVDFVGDYTMDGRILLLPITGKGKANITMVGLKTVHELIGEPIKKKGEVYIRFKEYNIKLLPKRVYLNFENLFNGDKVLGENMNRFMNENWELIFNELKGGYEDTFSYVFKDVTNKIFTKVPMNKIFLLDE
ncbi:protein takeout-like [Phlebotomus argentipes]|uniref:protein takeout-like n=1 Tax=Phlebotomus argentipes TaxID=94469 RepID=UPI0028936ACF|nr:protein takeout-like [Phlebotomus argentipes]